MGGTFILLRVAIFHPPGREITFQPNNGFYVYLFGSMIKVNHTEHGPMIGNCQSGHIKFFGPFNQGLDIAKAVKDRIFCVYVEVCKGHSRNG